MRWRSSGRGRSFTCRISSHSMTEPNRAGWNDRIHQGRRLLTSRSVRFEARYRGLGNVAVGTEAGRASLEHFLTERYCLFTPHGGRLLVGHIHHLPWPLEAAEAEIRMNELPAAHGITLPDQPPVLHFARELHVYIWSLREDGKQESPADPAEWIRV